MPKSTIARLRDPGRTGRCSQEESAYIGLDLAAPGEPSANEEQEIDLVEMGVELPPIDAANVGAFEETKMPINAYSLHLYLV